MHVSDAIAIGRAPEVVFGWIADPERARRWQPDVTGYEVTNETADLVGTEFREWLGRGRGSVEMRGRVAACVPNEQIAFDLDGGGISVASRYHLAPTADGTNVAVDVDIRLPGRLTFLLEPLVRRRVRRQMRGELETLRRLCEAEAPPT
ncbi:MAG: SRPBCC family protein [Chloroflexota bacterium]